MEKAGDVNPLLEWAKSIGEPASDEDETAATKASSTEPRVGSYEQFMSTFGSPARWAGR